MEEQRSLKADPFTRRQCRPTIVTKSLDPTIDAAMKVRYAAKYQMETAVSGLAKETRRRSAENTEINRVGTKATTDGDLFDVHDFDVKIDLEVPTVSTVATAKPAMDSRAPAAPRRSLNLADYKKRKGLI